MTGGVSAGTARDRATTRPGRRWMRRSAASVALGLTLLGATAAPAIAASNDYTVVCSGKNFTTTSTTNSADEAAGLTIDCVKKGGVATAQAVE